MDYFTLLLYKVLSFLKNEEIMSNKPISFKIKIKGLKTVAILMVYGGNKEIELEKNFFSINSGNSKEPIKILYSSIISCEIEGVFNIVRAEQNNIFKEDGNNNNKKGYDKIFSFEEIKNT